MGTAYESVTVDIADHVARVTLIGPGKGNAMGPAFWDELPEVFGTLDADPSARDRADRVREELQLRA